MNPSNPPPPPESPEPPESPKSPNANHITEDDVRHAAKLSRLRLTDDELHHFTEQLEKVLVHVSKLNELDVEGIEPMVRPMDTTNVWRADEPKSLYTAEQMLTSAPDSHPPFYKVTKVLDNGSGA